MVNLNWKAVIALTGGIMALYLFSRYYLVKDIGTITAKVDPTDPENVIFDWFTRGYQAITGSEETLGADIYDLAHPVTKSLVSPATDTLFIGVSPTRKRMPYTKVSPPWEFGF